MAKNENLEESSKNPATTPDVSAASESTDTLDQEIDSEPTDATDTKTDAAVEDIMKKDSDEVLKIQDEASEAVIMQPTKWERFKNWNAVWWNNPTKRWSTVGAFLVILGVLAGLPVTRYNILGVALKTDVTITAADSKSGDPVSGATVELSGVKAETNASGKAVLHVNMGSGDLKVTKKYYTGYSGSALVGSKKTFKATLNATGRQVSILLLNNVTGKPLTNAVITASGAKAKVDKLGKATLVVPSDAKTVDANVSSNGFNTHKVTLTAGGTNEQNTFRLTPTGKMYFLSNLSGTIDVVKTDLDGSNRQVVLAGTGSEDRYSTSLLASRDWKYLALLSKRSGQNASIYLIDTTNGDKLTTIDEGNAQFTLAGWSNDHFIYKVDRSSVQLWENNKEALKSFDPVTSKTLLLDQTQGSGNPGYYTKQSLSNVYLMDDQVVYSKSWVGYGSTIQDKQGELVAINADGSGHRVLKSFAYPAPSILRQYNTISVNPILYEPDGLYVTVDNNGDNSTVYEYDDGKVTATTEKTDDIYNKPYLTFLASPSGEKTFWAESRDGKNVLFTGDKDAKSPKQIMSLSEYKAYGWFTDDYLLVSKTGSELYIMGKDGGTPLKVTDYYKPSIDYQGYGGGYGGL